jgi:hypothetical protein
MIFSYWLGTDEFKAAGIAQADGGGRSAPRAIGDEAHLDPTMVEYTLVQRQVERTGE